MSVFEDLIGELKSENLLEETVINVNPAEAAAVENGRAVAAAASAHAAAGAQPMLQQDPSNEEKPSGELEFFRKRAMEEVASIQMVEHVLAGVERQHMKLSTTPFDNLNAKKSLHKFLQIESGPNSAEHAEAELELSQETEAWNFALYARDENITVANIRRFCEESVPVLSSQALIALARFYRNSPYSEEVRSKFDYVITRLFTRDPSEAIRIQLFGHDEMIGHINMLYAAWSSIALYNKEDDIEISLAAIKFDEFRFEVENAASFDDLLGSDFFTRVRAFKEEAAEMFYVPEVLAAAILCNLAIGNRYVELIGAERASHSADRVEEKYGNANDQMVSDAAGKTLLLADVLSFELDAAPAADAGDPDSAVKTPAFVASPTEPAVYADERSFSGLIGINKWLMVFCLVMILAGGGVYVWAEKYAGGSAADTETSIPVTIEDPELKKYLRSPSFTNETLFAVTDPMYDTLTEDERKKVLGKVWEFAKTQKLQKVNLLNSKGRAVAFASKDRFELIVK